MYLLPLNIFYETCMIKNEKLKRETILLCSSLVWLTNVHFVWTNIVQNNYSKINYAWCTYDRGTRGNLQLLKSNTIVLPLSNNVFKSCLTPLKPSLVLYSFHQTCWSSLLIDYHRPGFDPHMRADGVQSSPSSSSLFCLVEKWVTTSVCGSPPSVTAQPADSK